ncbi:diacylglycerol/lipid kinase family protein [Paenibacillus cymbidii]|uniref:diacylglycerol/lipid kinase family protein n=1 Tax=Paenibacillus cymbidii TaxID=1639034 RepID=UPI001080BD2E|nr:diacylglycerol kinase family protein [Paenibacillus cymbidii]
MFVFVVNPAAGNRRGERVWREVEAELTRLGVAYRAALTTGPGEAGELTIRLVREWAPEAVVAVGGDGTVHETVNGLWRAGLTPVCPFGHIAAGSGNDFARGHGLRSAPLEALHELLAAKPAAIDLLRLGDRVAVNAAGTGLDGEVAQTTNRASYKRLLNKLRLGKLSYVLSLVRVLATYRPTSIVIAVDDAEYRHDNVWLIASCNIPPYGGGMYIAPRARCDDGLVELCVVSGIGRLKLLLLFPLVYSGKHAARPEVSFYSGRTVRLTPARPLVTHTDGEQADGSEQCIEVLPGALLVLKGR